MIPLPHPLGKGKDKYIPWGRGNSSQAEGEKDIPFPGEGKLIFFRNETVFLSVKEIYFFGVELGL